ncbi:MAG: HIT family protein [Candidatus Helarchaeota archaeon]
MKHIWAPWRGIYVSQTKKESGCLFCKVAKENKDKENLVLARKKRCFIMLNLFPYNNGHLMISPYTHVANLESLDKEDRNDLFETVANACKNIKNEMKAEGFNVGINIGAVAGAGIAEHLHVHIVPRWAGDTNFMPVVGGTKVISEAITLTYEKLRKYSY